MVAYSVMLHALYFGIWKKKIQQIELDEFEDTSILAATLAWNNSSLCTFDEAARTFELSLYQVK